MNNQLEPYRDDNYNSDYKKEEAYLRAKKKVEKLTGFYWHLAVYIVVNIFLITIITMNRDSDESFWDFSTFSTAIFWGIGIFFHFLGVFGQDYIFSKDWEKRKIDAYMKKDREEMKKYE
ncbi:hypothetical protein D7030_09980 [Flavobacteriaceae bacterium AU392]|nr:hypothetical protein D1817_06830 [Flavobacteriaceae bacterium]RKM83614.1 hypothetical protein D7030_09980 [Flavobacteriaceae bacterium AU392]